MSLNEQRMQLMQQVLHEKLSPSHLEIIDDSAQHHGHPGAQTGKGHFTVRIGATAFADKPLVACHRLVYQALEALLVNDIHALSIQIIH